MSIERKFVPRSRLRLIFGHQINLVAPDLSRRLLRALIRQRRDTGGELFFMRTADRLLSSTASVRRASNIIK
jgi:CelD/BcsL family acetyltransferase involved in cellulose biosynthesis